MVRTEREEGLKVEW